MKQEAVDLLSLELGVASIPESRRRLLLLAQSLACRHQVRIKRWRCDMSGGAWQRRYRDGRVEKWIEAPRPYGRLSLSVFLHEVGHHVIGIKSGRRLCEDEDKAWLWAVAMMQAHNIVPNRRVMVRIAQSLEISVQRAQKRGLKTVSPTLQPFVMEGLT